MTRVRIVVEVDVTDEDKLLAYATRQHRKEWGIEAGDVGWDGSLEYGVIEALITSREGPSLEDMGMEVDFYTADILGGGR